MKLQAGRREVENEEIVSSDTALSDEKATARTRLCL
jgi:hypothetical protein